MTFLNKHASTLIDRKLKRTDKDYISKIESFNEEAVLLHKRVRPLTDEQLVLRVSEYVSSYIPHTDIWEVKFKSNLQNLEVATLQMIHLTFTMALVPKKHEYEWRKFQELQTTFPTLSDFAEKQFLIHYNRVKELLQQPKGEC